MAKVQPQVAAPAAPRAGGARPGTAAPAAAGTDKPGKEKRAPRVYHPALKPESKEVEKDGKKTTKVLPSAKLKEIPADYDTKLHKPLQRKHFEDESLWFELRAQQLEKQAARMRQLGQEAKVTGSTADKVKAKRLAQMLKRVEELKATLGSSGVDVEAIVKAAMAGVEKKEEKKEETTAAG